MTTRNHILDNGNMPKQGCVAKVSWSVKTEEEMEKRMAD